MKASAGVKYSEFMKRSKFSKVLDRAVISDGAGFEPVEQKLSLKEYDILTKQQKSRGMQQVE